MQAIHVSALREDNYDIIIEEGLLDQIGELIFTLSCRLFKRPSSVIVVTDECVKELWAHKVLQSLSKQKLEHHLLAVPEGETSKCLTVAETIWGKMLEFGIRRRSIVLALGGGVITDMAGFVAATYMRGIPLVNVPTTLMAQLDSSIGGKVAVDHRVGKNLIGAFYHPKAVFADPKILATLPVREIRNGLAEAIKTAVIDSRSLFDFISENGGYLLEHETPKLSRVVYGSAAIKVKLLEKDPYERNLRRELNFGHTVAHALEAESQYRQELRHGEAVSIGMATATRIAYRKDICSEETRDEILALLKEVGLPVSIPSTVNPGHLWERIKVIRMIRGGNIHFVLPKSIGEVVISDDISEDDLTGSLFA